MKVLIVVDMQNDFVDGALSTPEAQAIVPNVVSAIRERASADTVIIFTKDTHYDDYMNTQEGRNLPVPHCIRDTPGWNLNPEVFEAFFETIGQYHTVRTIADVMTANIIEKPTFGAVGLQYVLTELDDMAVMDGGIEEVTLCGLCTGICVLSNAMLVKATLPEVPVKVIENACACVSPESHATAIAAMKLCQVEMV